MALIAPLRGLVPAALLAVLGLLTSGIFTAGCMGPRRERPVLEGSRSLRLNDLDRGTHDIDAALSRGETVALVFWQPACRSCALEAPELNRAVAEHGAAIRFFGVVPGVEGLSDTELRQAAAKFGYRFPQTRDDKESLCRDFDVTATPTLIVLGAGREVRYRGHDLPGNWSALTAGAESELSRAEAGEKD